MNYCNGRRELTYDDAFAEKFPIDKRNATGTAIEFEQHVLNGIVTPKLSELNDRRTNQMRTTRMRISIQLQDSARRSCFHSGQL